MRALCCLFVQNLLEHEAEIMARPARTWFQTERQKREAAALAAAAALGGGGLPGGEGKAAKAAAKQAKRNARLKEARAADAAAAAAGGGKREQPALATETAAFNRAIRGVKSRARALMQQGLSAKAAQAAAQKAVTGMLYNITVVSCRLLITCIANGCCIPHCVMYTSH